MVDMTRGNPGKLLVSFAVPLVLANTLQQLYNTVDSAVVGRLLGTEYFVGVSMAGMLYWVVVGAIIGLSRGFAVHIAQEMGAGQAQAVRDALVSCVFLMLLFALSMAALGVAFCGGALALLRTPQGVIGEATLYLRILLAGLPVTAAYNLLAAVLYACGDSRTPLWVLLGSAIANVLLSYLFVARLALGVAGVALATLIAQLLSCALCGVVLHRRELVRIRRADMRLHKPLMRKLLALGLPVAACNSIVSLAGLAVQYVANGFGYVFATGVMAGRKLTDFGNRIGDGLVAAMAMFVGQNIGGREIRRVRQGAAAGFGLAVLCALAAYVTMVLVARPFLGLFLANDEIRTEALAYAEAFVQVRGLFLAALMVLQVARGGLEGLGDTVTPMLSSLAELAMRVLAVLLLTAAMGEAGIYLSAPAGWLCGAALMLVTLLMRTSRKAMF